MLNKILENWAKAQKAGAWLPCPRCGQLTMKEDLYSNAFSRRTDIYVCDKCGMAEAVEDVPSKSNPFPKLPLSNWFLATSVLGMPSIKKKEGEHLISVTRNVILTNENIDDIMSTALEGGINYWADAADIVEGEFLGDYASDQISRGGSLRIYDAEDDEEYILTLDKFLTGFAIACKNGYAEDWYDDGLGINTCKIDAEGADIIVQFALFGEIIFG